MAVDVDHDDNYLKEDASLNGERMSGGGIAMEVLTRLELDLAYSSEKLLNLEILLMQLAGRASDFEALTLEYEDISADSVEKALEFDMLSGILNSEVRELDSFMSSLQVEIVDAHENLIHNYHERYSMKIGEKLHDAEESLKQLQDQVADIRLQSAKFERTLALGHDETRTSEDMETENGHLSSVHTQWKLQTVDQQRHVLQMLERSLARELDLEKNLSDLRSHEDDLKLKLHYAERDSYLMEEIMETILERMFEAENTAGLLLDISKELSGKLQIVQLNLKGSIRRECELRSKLQESMVKLSAEESALEKLKTSCAEIDNILVLQDNQKPSPEESKDKFMLANSEVLTLREKVRALEEQLKESDIQLQLAKASVQASQEQQSILHSELSQTEMVIEGLKADVSKTESRAENAEVKCTRLSKTNMELGEQLGIARDGESEKAILLERKLRESDTQLEHAKASVEAFEEQQNLLCAALSDMEHTINDLKGKVSKAESRAENAEAKCKLLTETNLELNEEMAFLRGRLECIETSLHQADQAKTAATKDIGIRTKIISDLIMKLAVERERLQLQISALVKKNKILTEKCKRRDSTHIFQSYRGTSDGNEFGLLKPSKEALAESSTTDFQVEKSSVARPACETGTETSSPGDDCSGAESKSETVRTIEAAELSFKQLLVCLLVLLVSFLAFYLYQQQRMQNA